MKDSDRGSSGFLVAVAAFALLAGAALPAAAALAPAAGVLTEASGNISFTGGPYATPNPSGQAGTPVCNAALTCDDYALTVSGLSAATTAGKYIRVELRWMELGEAQFDLYVFAGPAADGKIIAQNLGDQTYVNPDVVLIPAINGSYTVRVIPFNPQGLSATGTIGLVPLPPVAPVTPGRPPSFSNHVSPAALGNSAGEPSIGVDWAPRVPALKHDLVNTGGVVFFQSGETTLRANFDDATTPATATWNDVSAPTVTAPPLSDPIGFTDRQTGRVFSLDLIGGEGQSLAAYSDDDGANWTPMEGGGAPAGPDHQTLGGGPYNEAASPPPPPVAARVYANAVYYCSQNIAGGAECSRSDDGGLSFGPGVPIFNPVECYGGIHGHVKVSPDGTVYVPNSSCSAGTGSQGVAISRDNGLTWVDKTIPGSTGTNDPSVGIGSDNTVYLGYLNSDGRPHVAVSTDHGTTWINDFEVGLPVGCPPGDQYAACRVKGAVFPVVVAGDGDRAAFGFLGTTTGGNFQNQATFQGIWNFYVATTYDRGAHWVTVNATPDDPVQKGSICLGGTFCGNDRNLLDFNDIAVDKRGRSVAAYADGCVAPPIGTCAAPLFTGRANKAAIVRQVSGLRLFAAFDPPNVAPIAALSATPASGTVPLEVLLDASGSSDPDAVDVIVSYTFHFGDGTADVIQAGPSISHTYTAAGDYIATVSVKDSRGLASASAATAPITVTAVAVSEPTHFTFIERSNVPLNSFVTSESKTLAGFAGTLPISVSGGNSPQFSVNGGPFTDVAGNIGAGNTLSVRHRSAGVENTAASTSVSVGGYSTPFKSTTTTLDRVPDAFDFGSQSGLEPGVQVASVVRTLVNYDVASIVAGPDVEYRINGGSYTRANGTLRRGQTLQVRHVTNSAHLGYTKTYLKVGGVTGYFTTRTK